MNTGDPQIFISFKNFDTNGRPTRDSQLAREVHDFLAAQGLHVFFSNVSLEKLGIAAYKKAIDGALDSAKVLIAVGTSGEHLDSQWVRYEWDSFLNDILSGVKPNARIFGYVENTPISSLPRSLRQSQVFDHGPGTLERLFNFVANALGVKATDFSTRISQTADRLAHVLSQGEAWRIGVVKAWKAEDTNRLICQIETDWQAVPPKATNELKNRGWSGSRKEWGVALDKPRVWHNCRTEQELRTISEEIILLHRVIFPSDPFSSMTFQSLPNPKFETPPWFKGFMAGGDLTIECKQCFFKDDLSYGRYETKPIAGECPDCGLGRKDWFVYFHGSPERQCKKCGYRFKGEVPPACPKCDFSEQTP
ncbi:MAG: toll/interleukin-1 receptor domain-containing protein [Candidatus Hydrogenedentes bacterium]|nr:toll/interleukin-1 receptor domain-containing protein [Candidatus Hydrogenedentota bacterium]